MKRILPILVFLLFCNCILSQDCLPSSPTQIILQKDNISGSSIAAEIEKYKPRFDDSLVVALKEKIAQCKLEIQEKLQGLETRISKLLLDAQEVLSNEDVNEIEEQIRVFEEGKNKSKDALKNNLNTIPHTGIFAVLIKNIQLYGKPKRMLDDAKMILEEKAIEDLNGTYIRKYTSIKDYKEVKDVIESLTSGEATSDEAYHSAANYPHDYFLYAANVTIKPLTSKLNQEVKNLGLNYVAINLLNDENYKEKLIRNGITAIDLKTLESKIDFYEQSIVRNRNEAYDEMHGDALKIGNEKVKEIEEEIKEARKRLKERKEKVRNICLKHNISFDGGNINKSANEAKWVLQEKIEKLQDEWKLIKEKEILHKEAYVSIQDNPFKTLGNKGFELYNQLLNEYAQFERNQGAFRIENLSSPEYKRFREVEGYRNIETIWVYPIPQENTEQHLSYFKVVVFAKFKILDNIEAKRPNLNPTFYSKGIDYYKAGDYDEAYKWLDKAANLGQKDAQYYIGKMFEEGLGIPINKDFALFWYKRAARQKHNKALQKITEKEKWYN